QRERHDETLAVERIEELPAVRVVVGAPDEGALACSLARARCFLGPRAPAEEITVAHGVVAGVERRALPAELEQPLSHAALVAAPGIDRTPALRRPLNDLDRESLWLIHEEPVALEARRCRCDERR